MTNKSREICTHSLIKFVLGECLVFSLDVARLGHVAVDLCGSR